MITRKYETKEECVSLFVEEGFDAFPSWVIGDYLDDSWEFIGELDEYEAKEQEEEYGYVGVPMWNTWWIPDWVNSHWIEEHKEETMDCGFTLIYHDGELFAIGIDGAGYSFKDEHFTPLYDAEGLTWHE